MEDFYLLPVGDKLIEYDRLAVNTVVVTRDGDIQTCDLPLPPIWAVQPKLSGAHRTGGPDQPAP